VKTYKHDLSNTKCLTGKMGNLIPINVRHTLPGDRFKGSSSAFIRVAPMLAPIMASCQVRIHHWFVPYRLIWDDWEDFITGGADGEDASVFPTFTVSESLGESTLADLLGVPPSMTSGTISALPFRAYQLIYNEYYRDKDLQTAAVVSTAAGTDSTTDKSLQNCCWPKDYFTVARPWEQRGPAYNIPMAETAPVLGIGKGTQVFSDTDETVYESDGTSTIYDKQTMISDASADQVVRIEGTAASGGYPNIRADLTDVPGTIEELRYAAAMERFAENRARWGGSYPEYLLSLGIRYSDGRLQRPQYLGGGVGPLQFSEVLQQTPDAASGTTDADGEGVGKLFGHGIGSVRSNAYKRFFEEHGIVISLMSVRPKAMYESGIDREFLKRTKEEFWQKELQHLGQQAVTYRELDVTHATPAGEFGWVDRYDEYRRTYNTIHGEFRTDLDFWTMARIFTSDPALNAAFVKCVPTTRVFASTYEDQLWCMIQNRLKTRRPVVDLPSPKLM